MPPASSRGLLLTLMLNPIFKHQGVNVVYQATSELRPVYELDGWQQLQA